MRFAYDRFGMGREEYKNPDYRTQRAGYKNPNARSSVGLESARNEMPAPSGSMGQFGLAPKTEPNFSMPSFQKSPFRAI